MTDMRIDVDATPRCFEPALVWLGSRIGKALDERIATLDQHAKRNPMLASYYRQNFALEYSFVAARKYRRNTGRAPTGPEYEGLYAFAIPAMRIYEQLSESAKRPFEGKLQDFVTGAYGARPFAYEIAMAAHAIQKGFDVEFADLTGTARFDFILRASADELELECKSSSGDAGRKIHRKEVNRLADLLLPLTEQLASTAGCHLLSIIVPDRLVTASDELSDLVSLAEMAVSLGAITTDKATVTYRHERISTWPEPANDPGARDFFENLLGGINSHILFHSKPSHAIVAVKIASARADKVVAALSEEAKKAAGQCSGNHPAIVAMHLIDPIEEGELEKMLRSPNGLHKIAHAVFKNEARAHVDSIVFTVPQQLHPAIGGMRRMTAPALVLFNDKRKFGSNTARSVFRRSEL